VSTFEFATANRIVFGPGKLNELGKQFDGHARAVLLVRGSSSDAIPRVRAILSAQDIACKELQVDAEPTVELVRAGKNLVHGCDMVIGLGGGSVLDTGKAIASLATNPGDVLDYLEVIGKGHSLVNASLPYIAIPTTAGTGTEVTRNAVIESREHHVKVSLRSPLMLPELALIDPELTYTLPPGVTASSGLDALTQLIEPFVSLRANPMTDMICRAGISLAARCLKRAHANGMDISAREGMSLASLFGGLAMANAALGTVHGFAGPLGGILHRGRFFAPHGAVCARLLPLVMAANLKALQAREPNHPALDRYTEIARILTGYEKATAQTGINWVHELVRALEIPPLSRYGMKRKDIPSAVEKTLRASSTRGNPVALTGEELADILEQAL